MILVSHKTLFDDSNNASSPCRCRCQSFSVAIRIAEAISYLEIQYPSFVVSEQVKFLLWFNYQLSCILRHNVMLRQCFSTQGGGRHRWNLGDAFCWWLEGCDALLIVSISCVCMKNIGLALIDWLFRIWETWGNSSTQLQTTSSLLTTETVTSNCTLQLSNILD